MKTMPSVFLAALFLIGCASDATPTRWIITTTPVPPTQTPWIITATPAQSTRIITPTPAPSTRPTVEPARATLSPGTSADTIQWNEAAQYVDQTKTVCGPVMRTTFAKSTNGQPTFIDLGRAYPDPARFSILIWGNQRAQFPGPPETDYAGKTLCVTGKIVRYQGSLELEAKSASQIQIK